MDIHDRRLSESEVTDLERPIQNDLMAFFSVLSDAAADLLDKAVRDGLTPDEFIAELEHLIDGDTRAPETAYGPVLKARRLDGRIDFQGLPVSVENAPGSVRSGVDTDGASWETNMLLPYGYVRGTEGVDGDAVDVFVGNNPESQLAFVVHVKNLDGRYDEDKCMIGFNSEAEARQALETHYDCDDIIQSVDTLDLETFRNRLETKPGKKIMAPKRDRMTVLTEIKKSLDSLAGPQDA